MDHLNDQKDEPLHAQDTNDTGKSSGTEPFDEELSTRCSSTLDAVGKNASEHADVDKSLKFLCVNLGE